MMTMTTMRIRIRAVCHHRVIVSPPELDMLLQGSSSLGLAHCNRIYMKVSAAAYLEAPLKTSVKCRQTSHFAGDERVQFQYGSGLTDCMSNHKNGCICKLHRWIWNPASPAWASWCAELLCCLRGWWWLCSYNCCFHSETFLASLITIPISVRNYARVQIRCREFFLKVVKHHSVCGYYLKELLWAET
jgi:hypothetical protein